MNERRTIWGSLLLSLIFALCANPALSKPSHRSKPRAKSRVHAGNKKQSQETLAPDQTKMTLVDGSSVTVKDAWQNEQGVWYRQAGVTYLVPRDRVKGIERGANTKPKNEGQVAHVAVVDPPERTSSMRPLWIYLTGGARVEVDSAEESAAGVWYRRGPLAVFIERSRIDHIEREEVETAESAASKKERGWTSGSARIDSLIRQSGAKYHVDPYLIFCVMEQESHFSTNVVSPKGARGLMQLMPGTSARFGVRHPFNPAENIPAGTRYLKQLIDQFKGRLDLVLASYNSGEGTVMKYGNRVPPYGETRAYVKRISYRYHRGKAPVASTVASTGTPAAGEN
jgi:Transglycosylase SLT domain